MLIQCLATYSSASYSIGRDNLWLECKTEVADLKAILLTFEPLLVGAIFACCAFTGPFAGPNWAPYKWMDGTYI